MDPHGANDLRRRLIRLSGPADGDRNRLRTGAAGWPRPAAGLGCSTVIPLEVAAPGRRTVGPQGSPYWLIEPAISELADLAGKVEAMFRDRPADGAMTASGPHELVFLDLETTGLSSTPLFLIGFVLYSAAGLCLRQYLARSYAEEGAVISAFAAHTAHARCVVSFNGKSFDVPFLRARAAATGARWTPPAAHVDLLHLARRRYKTVLPNCRLQTLEWRLCNRRRTGDIPGADIPEAYHEFVRTGHAGRIATILHHNALDLVTLVELYVRLGGGRVQACL